MKKSVITTLLLLLGALCAGPLRAEGNYYFKTLNVQSGLSQNTVNAILQDRQGYMWFGTKDGLNRYDGTRFRIFKHSPEGSGLSSNFITALCEDADGNIWIGTDAGLDIYTPLTESFRSVPLGSADDNARADVSLVCADPQGHVWVAVESAGIYRFEGADSAPVHFPVQDHPMLSSVSSMVFDQNGTMWLGCYGSGLYCSDDGLQTVTPYRERGTGREPLRDELVTSLVAEQYNNLVIGSLKSGVWNLNLTSGRLENLLGQDRNGGAVRCRELLVTSDRQLLAGTESGLFVHDLQTGRTAHLRSSYYDPLSMAANSVYAMCEDYEGGVWIGTYFGGVNYYSPSFASFQKYYPESGRDDMLGKRIREIRQDARGILWIGTEDGGLHRFQPGARRFSQLKPWLEFNNVHGLCLIGDDLWVGTIARGLRIIDTRTGAIRKRYENAEGHRILNDNNIYAVFCTKAREIFLGTQYGLMKYDPEKDSFDDIPTLKGKHVYDINEDVHGNLWVATYADGAWRYDVHEGKWQQYRHRAGDPSSLPYDIVISIFPDSQGRVWLTTQGGGCCRYDEQADAFVSYSAADGLPDEIVYQIVEDRSGKLWMTTGKGLVRFDPEAGEALALYTTDNGLLSDQFNYKSSLLARDGRIYLGSIQGLVAFQPDDLREPKAGPTLILSDFTLLGQEVRPGPDSPLSRSISYTRDLTLQASQNTFSFRIVAPNYTSPQAKPIEYMLEGYDNLWQSDGASPVASYSNLPPGRYTLRARLQTRMSGPSDDDASLALGIVIRPPFYLSPWALIFYCLSALTLLWFTISGIHKRNTERYNRQVEQIEAEKERAIYDSKIEFFTNIAHEIRTPLTLINGPLESILGHDGLDREVREDLGIMKRNTERLVDLTNQLLDFNKMESRNYTLTFSTCNVSAILRDTLARFSGLARQSGIRLELDTPEEDLYADIGEEAFTKIISNLVNNGTKYAATYLKVALEPLTDQDSFRITTENDGNVVPDALKEDIFKPFVRFRESGGDKITTGTGLGLGLSRSLAALHGGSLVMAPGMELNIFILTLPLRQATAAPAPEAGPATGAEEDPVPVPEGRKRVLVVDDDAELLAFIGSQLRKEYTVYTADNGNAALEILDKQDINLVISDVMMAGIDGFTLCNAIKSNIKFSHIPVILLTAKTNLQAKIEGMESGADSYLEKPFSIKYLKACIFNLLENREKLRRIFAQSPFTETDVLALSKADEGFMAHLDRVIEENYANSGFTMEDMAKEFNMSRASFYRKINGVLDMSPNDYLRFVRLKKAAQLFRQDAVRVNEACYLVGFNSPSYFAKCFQKQFGISPKDFLEKRLQEAGKKH